MRASIDSVLSWVTGRTFSESIRAMFEPVTAKASIWTTSSFFMPAGAVLPLAEAAGAGAVELSWAWREKLGKAAKASNNALGWATRRRRLPVVVIGRRLTGVDPALGCAENWLNRTASPMQASCRNL